MPVSASIVLLLRLGGGLKRRWAPAARPIVATVCQLLFSVPVAQQAIVTDALEAGRQHVQQEPADELLGVQRHSFLLGLVALILVAETDLALGDGQQALERATRWV